MLSVWANCGSDTTVLPVHVRQLYSSTLFIAILINTFTPQERYSCTISTEYHGTVHSTGCRRENHGWIQCPVGVAELEPRFKKEKPGGRAYR